jgi:hypothetical protein
LKPGYYPGGIDTGKSTLDLEPGVYYIGGGGINGANGAINSVAAGASSPPSGGGILIYNSEDSVFHAQCIAGTAPAIACINGITLNGGSAGIGILPLDDGSVWDGMVIFQDRNLTTGDGKDIQINGGDSAMEVAGTIYVPKGSVVVNGSGSNMILDQIIAWSFKINGSGGRIDILYRDGVTARISGVGLVE